VEAAGQHIHLFRDGLDYAFIRLIGVGAERVIRTVTDSNPSAGPPNRPVYESLQGEKGWPFRTPRRCHVAHR
jgi:hypothetical protein